MSTIIIQVTESDKADALVRFLKSIDHITSVTQLEEYGELKRLLAQINHFSENTELVNLSSDDIDAEVRAFRHGN